MIQIKILNHAEAAKTQGGLLGKLGVGLSKVGLLDIKAQVEEKVAKQIRDELTLKGVRAEVVVLDDPPGRAMTEPGV
ncbi:MAG: hypothetical protein ACJ8F7_04715 [Gemmataceae bacterium]